MLVEPMLSRLQAQQDLRSALQAALRDIVALHGAEFGNIQLADGQGGLLIVAQWRLPANFLKSLGRVDLQRGTVCARAARLGRTVFVANVEDDADFAPFLSFAHDTAFKSVLSSPLVSTKGQLIGVASAHFANRYAPTRVELHSLEEYCQSLADVVEAHLPEGDIGIAAEALHRELISATR
jgi:GAF domain-containing protein